MKRLCTLRRGARFLELLSGQSDGARAAAIAEDGSEHDGWEVVLAALVYNGDVHRVICNEADALGGWLDVAGQCGLERQTKRNDLVGVHCLILTYPVFSSERLSGRGQPTPSQLAQLAWRVQFALGVDSRTTLLTRFARRARRNRKPSA